MAVAMAAVGVALVLAGTVDALATTLRVGSRGGAAWRWLGEGAWRLLIAVDRRVPGARLRFLAGQVITLVIVSSWIATVVVGWFLVFSSSQQAVVETPGQTPASGWSRLSYAMSTVFTLGAGNLEATTPLWQVLTGVAAGSGLFLITLAITYLMPLTSAASDRRRVARVLTALGRSPAAIVAGAWDGAGLTVLGEQLTSLTSELSRLAEDHLTYPVLHYFQTDVLDAAIAPAVARLDEALLLLNDAVDPSVQPPTGATEPARVTVTDFLATVPHGFFDPAEDVPPTPQLDELRAAGVPCRSLKEFARSIEEQAHRRRRLCGLVRSSGWSWEEGVQAGA